MHCIFKLYCACSMVHLIVYGHAALLTTPDTTTIFIINELSSDSEVFSTIKCSSEVSVGIAIGILILGEGIIAGVVILIIALCRLARRLVKIQQFKTASNR